MAFDVDGVNIFFHQLVLLLLFDPKLFHRADLYAVLGGGQHLNLQKQHKYVKNNLANVQKIIKEDVVLGDCTALKIKNRRQHTVQQQEQQRVLHGDLAVPQSVHLFAHGEIDKQIYRQKAGDI